MMPSLHADDVIQHFDDVITHSGDVITHSDDATAFCDDLTKHLMTTLHVRALYYHAPVVCQLCIASQKFKLHMYIVSI